MLVVKQDIPKTDTMFDFLPEKKKMKPISFCYWLQGFFEITENEVVTENQLRIIKQHLDLVYGIHPKPNSQINFTYLG